MKTVDQSEDLLLQINNLKSLQEEELASLGEQFKLTYESLKPLNLIKSTLFEATSSPDIRNNVVNNLVGLVTGYASKKLLFGSTNNPIKKIAGTVLQFVITNFVGKRKE